MDYFFEKRRKETEKETVNVLQAIIIGFVIILITASIGSLVKKDLESNRDISQEQLKESFKTIEKFYKIEEIDETVLILKRRK